MIQFAQRFPDVAWSVLDVLAIQARYFLLFGQRLVALIQSDDPQIRFEPVGACPISWNGREWLARIVASDRYAHAVRPLRVRDRCYFGAFWCSALAAADAQLVMRLGGFR